jgi:hypothetical protein
MLSRTTSHPLRTVTTGREVNDVSKTTVVIEKFTLVDMKTKRAFERARADSTGSRDKPVQATPEPTRQPTTAPPASRFTQDDALTLFQDRDRECSSVKYPWTWDKVTVDARPGSVPDVWIVIITHDNGNVFEFAVNPARRAVTPANTLAAEAAQFCSGFDR